MATDDPTRTANFPIGLPIIPRVFSVRDVEPSKNEAPGTKFFELQAVNLIFSQRLIAVVEGIDDDSIVIIAGNGQKPVASRTGWSALCRDQYIASLMQCHR